MIMLEHTEPYRVSRASGRCRGWITALLLVWIAAFAVSAVAQGCPELLDHRFTTLQGKPIDPCQHANRPILVVNTASKCSYTLQFEQLEAMHRRYRARGLLVIGFPSNDFNQEFASNREIAEFCRLTYFVEFPMVEQGAVSGPHGVPFFRQLSASAGTAPQWNYHKYLIAPDGKSVYSFRGEVEPDSPQIMDKLRPMLR
jgi:glutathione peroxidase